MFTQPKVLINISSTVTMYTQLPDLIRSYKAVLMYVSSIPVFRPSLLCFWVAAVLCGVERLEALLRVGPLEETGPTVSMSNLGQTDREAEIST